MGPNAWNLLRIVVLVTGLILATALAMPTPRTRADAVLRALLAATPVLMILSIPKFAPELARFGVQEPLLVGGMALGGSLLVLAARSLLDERAIPAWRVLVLAFAGGVFWVVGVYQKEASLAVVPLLVAIAIAGRGRLARVRPLRRGQRAALVTIGILVVIPLAHVAIEVVRITTRGDLVYEAEVDAGRGIVRGVETLWDWVQEVFPLQAQRLVLAAVLLAVIVAIVRRRVDVLVVGALASGVLAFLLAAQSGVAASRYFIPVYALAAVALVLSVARLPAIVQVAFLLMVVALSVLVRFRGSVRGSRVGERRGRRREPRESCLEGASERLSGRGGWSRGRVPRRSSRSRRALGRARRELLCRRCDIPRHPVLRRGCRPRECVCRRRARGAARSQSRGRLPVRTPGARGSFVIRRSDWCRPRCWSSSEVSMPSPLRSRVTGRGALRPLPQEQCR